MTNYGLPRVTVRQRGVLRSLRSRRLQGMLHEAMDQLCENGFQIPTGPPPKLYA